MVADRQLFMVNPATIKNAANPNTMELAPM
jgi:hypothetical protein